MSARFAPKDTVSWKEDDGRHIGVITALRISLKETIAEITERKAGGWYRHTEQPTWKLSLVKGWVDAIKELGAEINSWNLEEVTAEEEPEDEGASDDES